MERLQGHCPSQFVLYDCLRQEWSRSRTHYMVGSLHSRENGEGSYGPGWHSGCHSSCRFIRSLQKGSVRARYGNDEEDHGSREREPWSWCAYHTQKCFRVL